MSVTFILNGSTGAILLASIDMGATTMAGPGRYVPSFMLSLTRRSGIHETTERVCNSDDKGRGQCSEFGLQGRFKVTGEPASIAVRTSGEAGLGRTYTFRVTESHAIVTG
jgi:hypothetical protein